VSLDPIIKGKLLTEMDIKRERMNYVRGMKIMD